MLGWKWEIPKDVDKSERAQVLVSKFQAAHRNQNLGGMMNLVYWEGVTPETKEGIRDSFEEVLKKPLKVVFVAPVAKDEVTEYTLDSVRYRPNLAPVGRLAIFGASPDDGVIQTSYLVGLLGEEYRIATATPAK